MMSVLRITPLFISFVKEKMKKLHCDGYMKIIK